MRFSLVIAAHNEGDALRKSIASCTDTCIGLDYEIVVVDDASTDGSGPDVRSRFPHVRLVTARSRRGASATKAAGAHEARGDVLVFLDGHCKPEPGAVERLVEAVEALDGDAIVTPTIAALDVQHWQIAPERVGHGYSLDLETLSCGWLELDELRPVRAGGRQLYESPALIGCALAVRRDLYNELWGFDNEMLSWGVEDLDFGLKCWLMGHRILHDPQALVGHRFRTAFDNYSVPLDHVLVNQLRMSRKHLGLVTWEDWLDGCRQRNQTRLIGHAEGLWAKAWHLFRLQGPGLEQERSYLCAHRTRDEFWFAERFGLSWPRLQPTRRSAEPGSFLVRSPSPSPSPSICNVAAVVPASVVLVTGISERFTAQGTALAAVRWTSNPVGTPSSGTGPTFTTSWASPGAKQVVAACGASRATARVSVVSIVGVLVARDNFAGRSKVRFGVGEVTDLNFQATPATSAAAVGGLRWFIDSGGGVLIGTGANDGTGIYTAPGTDAIVRLVLKIATGSNAGMVVATRTITIVAPNDALMVQCPGTGISHTHDYWSVGFQGNIFLRPTDVSFGSILVQEGTASGIGSGYLVGSNGIVHPVGPLIAVSGGNSTTGSQLIGFDTVQSEELGPPFTTGDFLWPIPWRFQVGTAPISTFTTANHHETADGVGTATIAKKGAGPFSRVPSDPTSGF
jgi:GT2 family glycosyltransferase